MPPSELREALLALRWSQRELAEALECDGKLVRCWATGHAAVPADVAVWLRELARVHHDNPPPQAWRRHRVPSFGRLLMSAPLEPGDLSERLGGLRDIDL